MRNVATQKFALQWNLVNVLGVPLYTNPLPGQRIIIYLTTLFQLHLLYSPNVG